MDNNFHQQPIPEPEDKELAPNLDDADDPSDDESYTEEDKDEDDELAADDFIPEGEALEDKPLHQSHHNRHALACHNGYTNLSINMLSTFDPVAMILICKDKLSYLGIIMTQISLKQGLKMFGE